MTTTDDHEDHDDRRRLAWQVAHYGRLLADARVLGLREFEARRRQTLRLLRRRLQALGKAEPDTRRTP
jgi:hypothetical protein